MHGKDLQMKIQKRGMTSFFKSLFYKSCKLISNLSILRIHFVTFEELKTNPAVEIAKIAQFLGVENNAEEVAAKSDFAAKDVHFKSPTEAATAEHNQARIFDFDSGEKFKTVFLKNHILTMNIQ